MTSQTARSSQKGQGAFCIWLTGLPGSGKSTIAKELEKRLFEQGRHVYLLDGDQLRSGLNSDLGFSKNDRDENIRRAGEVAKLMVDAGLVVICAFISPFRSERDRVRKLFKSGEFFEIYLDVDASVCEARDPKGHYRRARLGEISGFTGIDGSYEIPEAADLQLNTEMQSVEECVEKIIARTRRLLQPASPAPEYSARDPNLDLGTQA